MAYTAPALATIFPLYCRSSAYLPSVTSMGIEQLNNSTMGPFIMQYPRQTIQSMITSSNSYTAGRARHVPVQ